MNTETNNIEKMQNNLALIRDIAGWTTRDLAQKIGVSKKTISDLEDNKIAMTAEQYSLIKKEIDNETVNNKNNENLSQVIHVLFDENSGNSGVGEKTLIATATMTHRGLKGIVKNLAAGTAKVAGSIVLGTVGSASGVIEFIGAGSNMEIIEDLGHELRSASFNGVRKMWGADKKEYGHSFGDAGRRKADEIKREQVELLSQKENSLDNCQKYEDDRYGKVAQQANLDKEKSWVRRTDEELSKDKTGTDRTAQSYDHNTKISLPVAMHQADNSPGVYILWLDGSVMKCGRSSQAGGVRKRLLEYYRLDYDKRAKSGEHWAVTSENRDNVLVSWQCCPISKCHELEYKLFKKYGKGPWAHRAPDNCDEDSWELLI